MQGVTANDIRYGRRGGSDLPRQTPAEQAAAFQAAIDEGRIVRASCDCTLWWLVPRQIGELCQACRTPMRRVLRIVS